MTDEIRILVVDDELGIREGVRRVLETHDYQVDMAIDIQSGNVIAFIKFEGNRSRGGGIFCKKLI